MKKIKTPSPAEFPITFEQALRLAIGGRSVPDRFRIWRQWWKAELARVAKTTGVHADNTDMMLAKFRNEGVDSIWFHNFQAGIAAYRANTLSAIKRKAALARWHPSPQPKKSLRKRPK